LNLSARLSRGVKELRMRLQKFGMVLVANSSLSFLGRETQ